VVLDEILGSMISYGYDRGVRGDIVIRISRQPGEIPDTGRPFDPLQAAFPELATTLGDMDLIGCNKEAG
jgi:hypothetical protein